MGACSSALRPSPAQPLASSAWRRSPGTRQGSSESGQSARKPDCAASWQRAKVGLPSAVSATWRNGEGQSMGSGKVGGSRPSSNQALWRCRQASDRVALALRPSGQQTSTSLTVLGCAGRGLLSESRE
ncbi:hypothetical protein D3C71_1625910 [compost metagenome]